METQEHLEPQVRTPWTDDPSEGLSVLLGRTIVKIEGMDAGSERIDLTLSDGVRYRFDHCQECCEHVQVEDVTGDMSDLIGSPILMCEAVSNSEEPVPDR